MGRAGEIQRLETIRGLTLPLDIQERYIPREKYSR